MPKEVTAISEDKEPFQESLIALKHLERKYRHKPQELRVKALRLLKEDPTLTFQQVADPLGRSLRTLQRWWHTYQHQGLV